MGACKGAFFGKHSWGLNQLHRSLIVRPLSQESRGYAHPDSNKLGSMSGWNDSRDFWSFNDIGVATWLTSDWEFVLVSQLSVHLIFCNCWVQDYHQPYSSKSWVWRHARLFIGSTFRSRTPRTREKLFSKGNLCYFLMRCWHIALMKLATPVLWRNGERTGRVLRKQVSCGL